MTEIQKNKITVEIDFPVYNEERYLKNSIEKLISFLKTNDFKYQWYIVIVDNASTDNTEKIAGVLKDQYPEVKYIRINQKGRGRALRQAWLKSKADIVSYMDIDLSTDLAAFPQLIDAITVGGYDISTGSRMMKDSYIKRSIKREILSRGYIFILNHFLHISLKDAQCGFKALNRRVIKNILPKVVDQEWFFDSELLSKCQRYGYKVKEIPIKWIEDKNSKVEILSSIKNYLFSVVRLKKEFNSEK